MKPSLSKNSSETGEKTLLSQMHLVTPESAKTLQDRFVELYEGFTFYRAIFDSNGIMPSDPISAILDRFPVLDSSHYVRLQRNIFERVSKKQFVIDCTSGTTANQKIRFNTQRDEIMEEKLCQRFFQTCGLTKMDRIMALDIDCADIYLFYGRSLSRIGIDDFEFRSIPPDEPLAIESALKHQPTVIFTVPSLILRHYEDIERFMMSGRSRTLKKIIYIGDKMPPSLRSRLESQLGIEVFSFFGSTETGSIGGECKSHTGMHIYTDHVIPTILEPKVAGSIVSGEVAWTTLHFRDQPLVKYSTGDFITLSLERCGCGKSWPRIVDLHRTAEQFELYGQKFKVQTFLDVIEEQTGKLDFFSIRIDPEGKHDVITFTLPYNSVSDKSGLHRTILETDDLASFERLGFARIKLEYLETPTCLPRKLNRLVDNRRKKLLAVLDSDVQKKVSTKR